MKRLHALSLLTIVLLSINSSAQIAGVDVFINEIHYDNVGTDANEQVEIAGPAGTDLSLFTLTLYNGGTSAPYSTLTLSGIIPDQNNGYGTLCFLTPNLQNGAPDGLSLSNATSVQFLSYEGSLTAIGGAADGITSTDIVVFQSGDPIGTSLQLVGNGTNYSDFSWIGQVTDNFCAVNTNQSFGSTCNTTATISPVACGTYTSPSGNYTWTTSGNYLDTIPNSAMCDSIISIDLTVYPVYNVTDSKSICAGTSYIFGTQTLTTDGVYTETFPSVNNCDSTVELTLTTVTSYTTNLVESICQGETYTVATNDYTTTGNYSVTVQSSLGCDSTINLDLTVLPTFVSNISDSGCDSYTSPSGNYTWTLSGIYNDTIPSVVNGCDSVLIIDLTINNSDLIVFTETACDFFLFEGNTYMQSGTYDVQFQNQYFCDSIRRLELTIVNTPASPATTADQNLCDGDVPSDITASTAVGPVFIITGVLDGPLIGGFPKMLEFYAINDIPDLSIYGFGSANNGLGSDGIEFTFPQISLSAGEFYYVGTDSTNFNTYFGFYPNASDASAGNVNGDDAIELFENTTVIDVFGNINVDGTGTAWDYLDGWATRNSGAIPNNGVFNENEWTYSGINVLDGELDWASSATQYPLASFTTTSQIPTFNWYSDAALMNFIQSGATYTPSINAVGSETVYVTATIGTCTSSSATASVVINELPTVEAGNGFTICEGESITLSGSGTATTYTWDNNVTDNVAFPAPSMSTTYTVTGIDMNNCENTDQVVVDINPLPMVNYTDINTICVYNDPITLAAGSPAGGTYSGTGVTGSSFDPSTAGIGSATITYTYTDGNNCTNDAQWLITVDGCAGITDPDVHNVLNVYPNPSTGTVTITGLGNEYGDLVITDLAGKEVYNTVFSNDILSIDIRSLANGTYLLKTSISDSIIRIVKN